MLAEFNPEYTVVILEGNDLLHRIRIEEVKQNVVLLKNRILQKTTGNVVQVGPQERTHTTDAQADWGEGNSDSHRYVTQEEYNQRRKSLKRYLGHNGAQWPRFYNLHLHRA